jgi:hypothetical protein
MELNLSGEEAAFRDEVRAFIAENYPAEMRVTFGSLRRGGIHGSDRLPLLRAVEGAWTQT